MSVKVNIKDIADWIDTGTSFTKGTTLQVQIRTQSAPDRCVLVRNLSGGKTYVEQRNREDYMLQVIARAAVENWLDAQTDANTMYDFLFKAKRSHINLPTVTPTFRIESIEAVSMPQYLGEDTTGRPEYACNFILKCFDI